MKQITVVGTGYVGSVVGVCLADFGNKVVNLDKDEDIIKKYQSGKCPMYEPGLDTYLERVIENDMIEFTTDSKRAIDFGDVIFITVGTPHNGETQRADLSSIYSVAEMIGSLMEDDKIVVMKSTVPLGTYSKVEYIINDELDKRNANYTVEVVSNPEFLREGKAVYDFTHPDRVVIGSDNEQVKDIMKDIYRPLYLNDTPFLMTDNKTAELIKYASNSFLATKISFINEISNLCIRSGANIKDISKGMGMDGRISNKFLHPSPGYGGSCFPKDTRAIVNVAKEHGVDLKVISSAIQANIDKKNFVYERAMKRLEKLDNPVVSVLGVTFKAETDDIRESSSLRIVPKLVDNNKVRVCDPQGIDNFKSYVGSEISDEIDFYEDPYESIKDSDMVIILTEWYQFRNLDLSKVKSLMKGNYFYDTRNLYEPQDVILEGFEYLGNGNK